MTNVAFSFATALVFLANIGNVGAVATFLQSHSDVVHKVRVACIGDSITEGLGLANPIVQSYPAQLVEALPLHSYEVVNFGRGWSTVMPPLPSYPKESIAYATTPQFSTVLAWRPNIAIIILGTNDARDSWDGTRLYQFESHYIALIKSLQSLPQPPRILIGKPPPFYNPWGAMRINASSIPAGTINGTVLNTILPRLIDKIATDSHLPPPIDLFTLFASHCPNFNHCDWMDYGGLHPNAQGHLEIARAVEAAIKIDAKLAKNAR